MYLFTYTYVFIFIYIYTDRYHILNTLKYHMDFRSPGSSMLRNLHCPGDQHAAPGLCHLELRLAPWGTWRIPALVSPLKWAQFHGNFLLNHGLWGV